MSALEAFFLSLIQGLTEFLPVSSSGHLMLFNEWIGEKNLENDNLFLTIVLHLATVFSIITVYKKELTFLTKNTIISPKSESRVYVIKLAFSMLPVVLVGLFFRNEIEAYFENSSHLVPYLLIINGLILLVASKLKPNPTTLTFGVVLLIGLAQAIAILPGISRSGATICTALLLGVDRDNSSKFSFFMVIPVILGISLVEIISKSNELISGKINVFPLLLAFIVTYGVGVFACKLMINLVNKYKFDFFAYYCFFIGFVGIIIFSFR